MNRVGIVIALIALMLGIVWLLVTAVVDEMSSDMKQADKIHAQAMQEAE